MNYTKICNTCKKEKSIEEFHFTNKEKGIRRNKCNSCQADYIQKYKSEQGERLKDKWRLASRKYLKGDKRRNKTLAKYGLKKEDYNKMFDEQEGRCKICNKELTLVVDHCHNTNKIRGLLCNGCNVGLGCFEDNIQLLENAIKYLK